MTENKNGKNNKCYTGYTKKQLEEMLKIKSSKFTRDEEIEKIKKELCKRP